MRAQADRAEPVLRKRHGARAEVILNRPHRRNAITGELIEELGNALGVLDSDDSVRAIVLRGADRCFCSGLDLGEPDLRELGNAWADLHLRIDAMTTPVVAALERAAINAGAALALACDLLVAGETAVLQVKEAAMGMTPPVNLAWLATKFPRSLALRLALGCEPMAGPQLVTAGVALRSVPDSDVVPEARRLADNLAGYPGAAGAKVKASIRATGGAAAAGGFATALEAARGAAPR